jgi:hypothetical protein
MEPAPAGWLVGLAEPEAATVALVVVALGDFVGDGDLVGAFVGTGVGGALVRRGVGVGTTVGLGVGGRVGVGVGTGVGVAFGQCEGLDVGGARRAMPPPRLVGLDAARTGAPKTIATATAAINDAIGAPIRCGMFASARNDHGPAPVCR